MTSFINVFSRFYSKTLENLSVWMPNCFCTFANTTTIQKASTYKAVCLPPPSSVHHRLACSSHSFQLVFFSSPLSSPLACPLNLLLTFSAALSLSPPSPGSEMTPVIREDVMRDGGQGGDVPCRHILQRDLTGCVVVKLLL